MKVLDEAVKQRVQVIPKQCWWNAIAAGRLLRRRKRANVRYVEGIAIMKDIGVTFEHAWLTLNGEIIEVTLDHLCPGYYPAKDFDVLEAGRLMRKNRHLGMPLTGWPGMLDPKAWRAAHVQAMAKAMNLPISKVEDFFKPFS